mmetsp:Transcript_21101/g.23880  ORF Transcript_21101/g.23880 Transcript_21101/m.23880 type:complete len:247 (+) Transcript_21101:2-742(+)
MTHSLSKTAMASFRVPATTKKTSTTPSGNSRYHRSSLESFHSKKTKSSKSLGVTAKTQDGWLSQRTGGGGGGKGKKRHKSGQGSQSHREVVTGFSEFDRRPGAGDDEIHGTPENVGPGVVDDGKVQDGDKGKLVKAGKRRDQKLSDGEEADHEDIKDDGDEEASVEDEDEDGDKAEEKTIGAEHDYVETTEKENGKLVGDEVKVEDGSRRNGKPEGKEGHEDEDEDDEYGSDFGDEEDPASKETKQ